MEQAANLLIGGGVFIVFVILAYGMYQSIRFFKPVVDKEEKYELFEELTLDNLALKKGHKLEEVLMRRKSSFRKRLQEEMIKEAFPKSKK